MPNDNENKNEKERKPTIAPSIDTHNSLEQDATEEEIRNDQSTEVTRLYLDRTPEE